MERSNWAQQPWLLLGKGDIDTERRQCVEEGKDLSALESEFAAVEASDLDVEASQQRAEALLRATAVLPIRPDFPHREPSDLESIRAERPAGAGAALIGPRELTPDVLLDKALGAWQGRSAGCLLGKPAEGRRSWQIEKYLKSQGRWPLDRYFSQTTDPEISKECGFPAWPALYEEGIDCMVEDDDTNYTATGLAIVKQYGPAFTPADVARFWLGNIPIFHVCTAERAAYRNLVMCIPPPASAVANNPYREWIGAQIRADFFGYVCPANPQLGAEMAWRDAAISHVKNGIYGEMWVAAMLSAAYVCDDVDTVIRVGLAEVPSSSRLTDRVEKVLALHAAGGTFDDAIAFVRARWDESSGHDWCHTISNAEIVAAALLWGDMDFERTICAAVTPGFDTDCNGATAGSVLGLMLGAKRLPAKWIAPMNDTLLTGVAGFHKVSLTQMAQETVDLVAKVRAAG